MGNASMGVGISKVRGLKNWPRTGRLGRKTN